MKFRFTVEFVVNTGYIDLDLSIVQFRVPPSLDFPYS